MDDVEKRYLEYFYHQVVPKVCGVFKPTREILVILQSNHSERLLVQGILAFAAAYKSQNAAVDAAYADFTGPHLRVDDQQYALRQYLRMLSGLRTRLQNDRCNVERLVPLLCLLLAIVELLQGGGPTAVGTHIGTGLRTLTQLLEASPTAYEVFIFREAFRRMYLLSSVVSGSCSELCLLSFEASEFSGFHHIPPIFVTTYAARGYLETILASVIKLKEQCRTRRLAGSRYAQSMKEYREGLQRSLDDWDASFQRSLSDLRSQLDHRTIHGIRILQTMQAMVSIMVTTVLSPESAFDDLTDQFKILISHVVALWDATGFCIGLVFENKDEHRSGARFILDTGIIAPIYYTAIKCRVPTLRRQAISILEEARYREGLWSSASVAQAARAVMLLEEGDTFAGVDFGEAEIGSSSSSGHGGGTVLQTDDDCRRVEDSARFYDVKVLTQDDVGTKGMVQCWRRYEYGPPEPVVSYWGSES